MKVWIVRGHYDYEGFQNLFIATTKNKAEEYSRKKREEIEAKGYGYDEIDIEEIELNTDRCK